MRALFLLLGLLFASCAPRPPALSGTDLGAGTAPDFTLTDARSGQTVTLSSLRGKVVALAFLYTRCPDVCPLTATYMARAQRDLGDDARGIALVAVSVDPEGDTPDRVRDFSAAYGLDRDWHYLIGPRALLAAVWQAYGVRAVPDEGKPTVTHSDAIYLIDAAGRERVLMHSSEGSDALVANLRALLRGA